MHILLLVLSLLVSTPAFADGFQPFAGNWSGVAQGTTDGANSEKLTCRAFNTVAQDGRSIKITLRCANSAGVAMRVTASMTSSGTNLSGSWAESTYNVGGSVSGSIQGSKITSKITSPNWNAGLQVSRNGDQLAIAVVPSGGSGRINITMRK